MRPAWRLGIGRMVVAVCLAFSALVSMAFGQGWKPEAIDPKGHSGDVLAVAGVGTTLATAGSDGLAKVWEVGHVRSIHRVDLVGHEGRVLAVAVSPDGKLVATGGADRTVRLWDSSNGATLATLKGHSGPVEALAFSPDGRSIASGSLDTTIRIWGVDARTLWKIAAGHEQGVRGLAFAPNGKTLASASRDHSVRLWDPVQGTALATLGRHDAPAWSVAFSPDNKMVASGGLDKTVRLWRSVDPDAGPGPKGADNPRQPPLPPPETLPPLPPPETLPPLPPPEPRISARLDQTRAESPDVFFARQTRAVSPIGAALQTVLQGQGQPTPPNQLQAWPVAGDAVAVAFSPDGHQVAAALSDLAGGRTSPGSVSFLPLPAQGRAFLGEPMPPPLAIRGHLGPIRALTFARNGETLATVGADASVRTWNAAGSPLDASIGRSQSETIADRFMAQIDSVEALAISPDGQRVATASGSVGVSLWDQSTKTLIGRLRDPSGAVRAVAISPDGKTLATGGDGKVVALWEMVSGLPIGFLKGHLDAITILAFSPDGQTLASGSKDASVTLWDLASRSEMVTLARHTSAVTNLAFRPDGQALATSGLDHTVKLWELPSGRYVDTLDAHQDVVDALAFAPDGQTLASADRTGTIRLWDVGSRAERTAFKSTASEPIRSLAFAPDGRTLMVGDDVGSIRRWDLSDGRVIAFRGHAHAGPILALAFGPGGKTLASGGGDRELKVWDVAAQLAPARFADLQGKVHQIAVSADGKSLATASADQFVRVWDLATGRERFAPIAFEGAEARIRFSPDGKLLGVLSVGTPGEIPKLHDVATGEVKNQGGQLTQSGTALAFTPDGQAWAIADGQAVDFWDLGQLRRAPNRPDNLAAAGSVRSMAFGPDGQALAVGLLDGSVERLDQQEERKESRIFRSSNNSVEALAYSPDGRSLAIGGTDRVIYLLDSDKETVRLKLKGHRRGITGLAFSPDGKTLASAADGEPAVFVWDLASGGVVSNPTLPGGSVGDGLGCLAFSPDGQTLFAGGMGVIAFDLTEGRRPPPDLARTASKPGRERATLRGHTAPVHSLAFAGAGKRLVTRSEDGVVKVWDLAAGGNALALRTFGESDFPAQAMALHPDGQTLALGLLLPANQPKQDDLRLPAQQKSDEVIVRDIETGEVRGIINDRATHGGVDRVIALGYARDGRTLATIAKDGFSRIWDAKTLEPRADLDPRDHPANVLQFSPDGKTLMAADASGLVTLSSPETGTIRAKFGHDGGISQVLYSPDGRLIATAGHRVSEIGTETLVPMILGPGSGGDVRLWDSATGRRVAVLPMESGPVGRIAFSTDGKFLAASTTGAVATVWDLASTSPVVSLAWPSGESKFLAFSPDGQTLAIGGEDETLRIWNVPAGTLRAALSGHTDTIQWVAFSPDGQTIATAGRDATVKLWDVPKSSLVTD